MTPVKPAVLHVDKRPGEVLVYSMDLWNNIPQGDSLGAVVSVTATPSGDPGAAPLTLSNEGIVGTTVQVTIAGGTPSASYDIVFLVSLTSNPALIVGGKGELSILEV